MSEVRKIPAVARDLNNELTQAASFATVAKTRIGSPAGWLRFLQLHDWSPSDAWEFLKEEDSYEVTAGSVPASAIDPLLPSTVYDQMRGKLFKRITVHQWTPWSPEAWGFKLFESNVVHRIWYKSSSQRGPGGVEVAWLEDDAIAMRNGNSPDSPVLAYTLAEWDAFITGARQGDFDHII